MSGSLPLSVEAIPETKAEDFALMRGIADRDQAAFRALYDKHSGLVYTMAMRILKRPQDAEELVGEVFFELWDKSSRYDQGRASPITYLVTLTRSRCIDRTRRKAYRSEMTTEAVENIAPPSEDSPADDVAMAEQRELVRSALDGLDDNQRQVIEAAYYDGLSHSEIAAKYQKPLGTVKTYIRQGLIRLRDVLRKTSGPGLPAMGNQNQELM
ncbi:MAG: sigma-70 family RNA polymerase sigma factor [Burkholderiales bacterium]|nr:sigma-70 family RNA polymerase sigma factor [Phycisphaerae bacterium]